MASNTFHLTHSQSQRAYLPVFNSLREFLGIPRPRLEFLDLPLEIHRLIYKYAIPTEIECDPVRSTPLLPKLKQHYQKQFPEAFKEDPDPDLNVIFGLLGTCKSIRAEALATLRSARLTVRAKHFRIPAPCPARLPTFLRRYTTHLFFERTFNGFATSLPEPPPEVIKFNRLEAVTYNQLYEPGWTTPRLRIHYLPHLASFDEHIESIIKNGMGGQYSEQLYQEQERTVKKMSRFTRDYLKSDVVEWVTVFCTMNGALTHMGKCSDECLKENKELHEKDVKFVSLGCLSLLRCSGASLCAYRRNRNLSST